MSSETLLKELSAAGLLAEDDARAFVAQVTSSGATITDENDLVTRLVAAGKLTQFQGTQALKGKAKLLSMGEYVILDRIGAGGMGNVYKARHRRMKRIVALKVLSSAALKNADGVKRFQREVEAAAKLSHPNIVTAHDAGEARGQHYLVMEYVAGRDLSARVNESGPLPVADALNYVTQAARGLAYAHGEGVIHRDIKPANLLLDNKGVVKILDMGLARIEGLAAAAHEGLTHSGQVMGTVDYMAPEQAFDTHSADARSDVYSLGCSLYRLLVADHMYAGESLMQKFMAHREAPIPDLRAKRQDVSPELDKTFKRMVAKNPDDRFRTMNHVVQALEKCRAEIAPASSTAISVVGDGNSDSTGVYVGANGTLEEGFSATDENQAERGVSVQTLSSVSSEVGTDPSSKIELPKIDAEPVTTLAGKRRSGSPWWKNPFALGAAAAGLVLVLFGVWIIIRDDKGKEVGRVKVEVPPGGKVEVREDGEKVEEPKLMPTPPSKTPEAGDQSRPKPLVAPFDAAAARAGQEAWAKHLGMKVETTNSLNAKMILIPPGEFLMGSTMEEVEAAEQDYIAAGGNPTYGAFRSFREELPQHLVKINRSFALSATEVTYGEFSKFVKIADYVSDGERFGFGGSFKTVLDESISPEQRTYTWRTPRYSTYAKITDDWPVTEVTWNDAMQFCNWLSAKESLTPCYVEETNNRWNVSFAADGYRLPTEAEWEYACRAGTMTRFSCGDDSQELDKYACLGKGSPQAVRLRLPNAFGVYDMHGNVFEWCQDYWSKDFYSKSPSDDPVNNAYDGRRVVRGSSYLQKPDQEARSAKRNNNNTISTNRDHFTGFRVARTISRPMNGDDSTTQRPAP